MRSLICAMLLTVVAPAAAVAGDLKLTITDVKDDKGFVLGAIYDSPASFMKPEAATTKFRLKAAAGQVSYVFHNLKPGKYAITVFHDANNNGKLDTNSTGIPIEGYGFSNNAQGVAGPPTAGQAAFDFDGQDKAITIGLDY